ncbi:hypothetical protein F5Y13DRAFT_181953 [Hypoxylon sp. FL1857]|nr:hypothetical protein F5Y13DRAFT_181953 [Hypoxylon sp. FL1857]
MASNDRDGPTWTVKQRQIDRFFDRIEKRRASAACIQGPHASGKSTTMVAYILDLVRAKVPDAPMVYLLPTNAEATLLAQYFRSSIQITTPLLVNVPEEYSLPAGVLLITSYKVMLRSFRAHGNQFPFSQRAVVLVDSEANPTTDGEVLFGRLVKWAHSCREAQRPAAAVVTISPFASARTEDVLNRFIRRKPDLIHIPTDDSLSIPLSPMGERWEQGTTDLLRRAVATAAAAEPEKVLLGSESLHRCAIMEDIDQINHESIQGPIVQVLQREAALRLSHDLGLSLPWQGLKHFISDGWVTEHIFDRGTSQIVLVKRSKTKTEILREQSWLLKSGRPLHDTVFHTNYEHDHFEQLSLVSDPRGRAYNVDILWTALSLVHEWPSTLPNSLPIRRPPDDWAMREAMRRLVILRCTDRSDEISIGTLSEIGLQMLSIKKELSDINFHAAYLLTSIPTLGDELSSNVKRVIIRLAVILNHGIDTICTKEKSAKPLIADEVRRYCQGVGATLAHRGAAWIALGVWQKKVQAGISRFGHGLLPVVQLGAGLQLHVSAVKAVQDVVARFEAFFGLTTMAELAQTELTEDEIRSVEVLLLRSHLHRTVVFQEAKLQPFDLVSYKDLTVGTSEILDPMEFRLGEDKKMTATAAIYSDLELGRSGYVVRHLTMIPTDVARQVYDRMGDSFSTSNITLSF